MLTKGEEALPYKPYAKHTLPIPEAVQALDGYGDGISDTVYNYVDFESKQLVKRVEKVVFDGTENWTAYNSNTAPNLFMVDVTALAMPGREKVCLCSHFPHDSGDLLNGVDGCRFATGSTGTRRFYVSSSTHTDSTSFKNWIAEQYASGKPVTLVYELFTTEIIDISDLLTDNLIPVEGGGTLTFKNEYEYAVPHKFAYYKTDIKIKGTAEKAVCDADGNDIAAKFKALEAELATLKASLS
jgi:hypothetical protein